MIFDTLILSFIQGISEILPVSSSVNLHFFSSIFHITDFTFSLKIALHVGSLGTLLIYFRHELADIISSILFKKNIKDTYLLQLIIGTIPVIIIGFLCKDMIKNLNNIKLIGILSILFGIILVLADSNTPSRTNKRKIITIFKSFVIGCFQAIAIIPGVSRLGICITASRLLGIERKKAIQFSLLLAIPSIVGSLILELIDQCKNHNIGTFMSDSCSGIALTMIVGLIFIWPCVKFMENHGFVILSLYRITIGLIMTIT